MKTKKETIDKVWDWLYQLWDKHVSEIADPSEEMNAFTQGGNLGVKVDGKTFLISIKEVK